MLVWWILSLIILISCIVFAYRMIVSTYEFLPAEKRYFLGFYKNPSSESVPLQRGTLKALDRKVQVVEDNTTFYGIQFSKLQDRLKVLEELTLKPSEKPSREANEDEENWKELYY